MLVNRRRKRRARRRGRMPAALARYWAARRGGSNPKRRRRSHRKGRAVAVRHVYANPRVHRRRRRHNPRRSGGMGSFLSTRTLKQVGFATLGALAPSFVTDRLLPMIGFPVSGYLKRAIQFAVPTAVLAIGGRRVLGDGTAAFTIAAYGVTGVALAADLGLLSALSLTPSLGAYQRMPARLGAYQPAPVR